jgi:hypothetical protein
MIGQAAGLRRRPFDPLTVLPFQGQAPMQARQIVISLMEIQLPGQPPILVAFIQILPLNAHRAHLAQGDLAVNRAFFEADQMVFVVPQPRHARASL